MIDAVISARSVRKIYPGKNATMRYLTGSGGVERDGDIVAIDDISVDIPAGQVVGIVGRNGAGKSTLIRVLCGIARQTSGTVKRRGAISTMLDVGVGLSPFMTGSWNIKQRLEFLGVRQSKQQRDLIDWIVDFADIEAALEKPLYTYSAGMRVRLGFAIATAIRPEVLFIDEVLAVGDEFFAAKSFRRIQDIVRNGATCVIVSHDWTKIFRLSDRVLWVDKGRLVSDGRPAELMFPFLRSLNAFRLTKTVRIVSVVKHDRSGESISALRPGEGMTLRVSYEGDASVGAFAVISECLDANSGDSVLSAWSPDDGILISSNNGKSGVFEISFDALPLHPGSYYLSISLVDPTQTAFPADILDMWGPLEDPQGSKLTVQGELSGSKPHPILRVNPRWSISKEAAFS